MSRETHANVWFKGKTGQVICRAPGICPSHSRVGTIWIEARPAAKMPAMVKRRKYRILKCAQDHVTSANAIVAAARVQLFPDGPARTGIAKANAASAIQRPDRASSRRRTV